MYKLWPGQAQYMYMTFLALFDPCDLDLKNASNGTSPPQGQQLYQIVLKFMHNCTSYDLDKSGRKDARTHAHTPNKNCNNYVSLTRKWARQKIITRLSVEQLLIYPTAGKISTCFKHYSPGRCVYRGYLLF